jgi:hypothetical protein
MKNYSRYFLFIILIQLYPSFVWGNEFRLAPSISFNNTYNSNILISANEIKKDFVTILSPGVEMVNRTGRFDTDLLVRLDRLDYADNPDLSATNQMYNGKFRYLAMPQLSISAEAGYTSNANPTLGTGSGSGIPPGTIVPIVTRPDSPQSPDSGQSDPNPPGNPSPGPGAAGPMVAVPLNRITSSLSAHIPFTEKTATVVSYNYGRDYYEDRRYHNGISHDVNAGFVYDLGRHLSNVKGRLNTGYSYYYLPDSRNSSVMGSVGFSWDFNEVWSILTDGGIRRTWSEVYMTKLVPYGSDAYISVRERLDNDGWGGVGKVSLSFNGEYLHSDLTFNRDLTLASGLNGAAEHTTLTLSIRHTLMYDLSILFTAGYDAFKSDPSNYSAYIINQKTFSINPGVRYEFSKERGMEASYSYTRVDGAAWDTAANAASAKLNSDEDRHMFSIRLYIRHHFLE